MGRDKVRSAQKVTAMAKTLFISDLDGTLLGADSAVSPKSAAMLNEAIERGALFSVATARTPSTVSRLLASVHTPLPFIVMTGAAVWDPSTGSYSDVITIPEPTACRILDSVRSHRLPAFIYTLRQDVIHIYHYGDLSPLERKFVSEREDSPFKLFHLSADGSPLLPERLDNVILFYAMQPSQLVEAAYADIRTIEGCNPIYYHDIFGKETGIMEVFSADASKANALLRLKAATGADKTVAFGDNLNDIPMLEAADVAVAVENAVDEVKRVADFIIPPNTDDSVARFILQHTL